MSNSNSYVMASASSQPWANERSSIKSVYLGQEISPVSAAHWFRETRNMETGDFTKLNTSEVTDMSYMFFNMSTRATIWNIGDLSSWNVSKVTDMNHMFYSESNNVLEWNIGDLSNWDVSNVTDISYMFYYAGYSSTSWNIGNIGKWDVSKVINMNRMFQGAGYSSVSWCIGDLSNWDVSNVTDMSAMFSNTGYSAKLWNIEDLSKWDTSKVTTMEGMFYFDMNNKIETFSFIGTLNIPADCNMYNFVLNLRRFNGNFIINDTLSSYQYMFQNTATSSSGKINLYYKTAEAEAIVDELISLYGPNGTVSKGNIYKVDE